MAKKGERAELEPKAKALYAQRHTLSQIAEKLNVSVTSLSNWKGDSRRPDQELDEWDLARTNNRSLLERLRALLEREVGYAESVEPGQINPASMDALSKIGAIVSKMEAEERRDAELAAKLKAEQEKGAEVDRARLFQETLEWVLRWLRAHEYQLFGQLDGVVLRLIEAKKEELNNAASASKTY
ncbi:hypothetical protein [Candidatus Electronema sp. JM]|uniref:hypothetical protein n=1 Tax=Candidatus Electronema sp. JM TaxID=3401571 RepID=UPI003AA879CE